MADILTNLRELSVGYYFFGKRNIDNISPDGFLSICNSNIRGCRITQGDISQNPISFSFQEKQTIINGLNLGRKFEEEFDLPNGPAITWVGSQTQSGEPIDIVIDGIKISLKEDSFILGNMGLYKLLNYILGTNEFCRGLHIFESFSPEALEHWFECTRNILIEVLSRRAFNYAGGKYQSSAFIDVGTLTLVYNKGSLTNSCVIPNFRSCSYKTFMSRTNSVIREKVFSKIINGLIKNNDEYKAAKVECCVEAGENLVSFVGDVVGTSNDSILSLFRIQEYEYYYAKTTSQGIKIYRVPGFDEGINEIVVKSFTYSVPRSQLNIITEIENVETGEVIVLRNELRYSHGQFNGTPEAKLYYDRGSDLSALYERVC